ncbi:MAG: transcriptional repressor LexA [Bacilli bacterium]
MKDLLTKKQKLVLDFIKRYYAEHNYPPSIREICDGVGLNSTATVFVHLKNLESKNYLKTTNNKFRSIELLVDNEYIEKNEDIVKVPLLGKITAGNPILAIEQPDEYFDVPTALIPKNGECFVLHVSGTSMINKGIYDNDYVIIKRQVSANNGDIVVAMTEDNEVTLKTFYKEKDHIRLQPENDTMAPLIFDNITILGKAIGLYRSI